MKIKTTDLTGPALDWAVAKALGRPVLAEGRIAYTNVFGKSQPRKVPLYSTDWAQGGPIIEREEIGVKRRAPSMRGEEWEAMGSITAKGAGYRWAVGPTPLIAAMRCFVASRLGEEVDVPDELR
jgi:hypothetical protein